ncbi:MAG TPA: FAD-binding protein [Euryarchaeota archaeon]|nr:FAD-binding protein [Euryarchaeota archaeon]
MKTVVVGSGMAGIIAGFRAYSHGSDVVMISQGRSATYSR